ncbi:MAG: FAD binding domain-containing protein [Pseudomonadota bacterium]
MYTMTPAAFDYHRPSSVDEALALLAGNGETRALAGGHSLLPAMKLRLSTPSALVDLGGIAGLDTIEREGDELVLGALATHAAVAASELVREACPVLAEAAGMIGDRQVRNRGTIGGSIAHADPAADYPTVTKALGATIVTASRSGGRSIGADDCFVDVFTTALEPGELITSVRVPVTPPTVGAAYVKHSHPASRYAVVGVAAVVGLDGGTCSSARVVVGGATGAPVAVPVDDLVGEAPTTDAIAAAAARAREAIGSPLEDTYASGDFRLQLVEVTTRRALASAVARAG